MNYQTNVHLTRPYFPQCYDESLEQKPFIIRTNIITASVFLVAVYAAYHFELGQFFVGSFSMITAFELYRPTFNKHMWLRKQFKSGIIDKKMDITINDDGFSAVTPVGNNSICWEDLFNISETERSVFLWPQKGQHIYLPKSSLTIEAIDFILSKKASV